MKGKMMNGRAKRNTGGVNQAKETLTVKTCAIPTSPTSTKPLKSASAAGRR